MKNVMVILCDQFRPDFISCYNENSPVKTPNIDNLYHDGLLCEHAVTASPVCAPGRASMMTGTYLSRHGVWTNDVPFNDGLDFLPMRMKEMNYACGAFGKLHHFPGKDSKGFDVAWQMEERRLGDEDDYLKYLKTLHPDETTVFPTDENGHFAYNYQEYYEHQIANRAMSFIEENKNSSPFFTWVSFQGPHGPMDSPIFDYTVDADAVPAPVNPEFNPPCQVPRYRKSRGDVHTYEQNKAYRADYVKMIEFIDFEVGRITKYLKENNLYENTVIIFSTDHGDLCGDYNMHQKGPFLYAAQLEVPMIIANHDNLPKNTKTTMLTSNLDIGATILNVAGDYKDFAFSRDISAMYCQKFDKREEVYTEFADSMRLLSTKEYRFAYFPFSGECELVKICNETENLANKAEYQELKAKFLMKIIDYMIAAKGVNIEAQDLTPKVQQGLSKIKPNYKDELTLVFPIASKEQIDALERDGLDSTYNEFCKTRNVVKFYGKYWD
ncbi:MAG: sulfatase-like hydrolase/transferase [Clostridia bacterium]